MAQISKAKSVQQSLSQRRVARQHLGGEAELTAIHMGTKQLWNHGECQTGRIYTDSQSATMAIDHPHRQSGQAILKDVLESINEIMNERKNLQIEIV